MTEIINFSQIARAFYMEPLALEEGAMLAAHMYLWPRITGSVQDSAPFMREPQSDKNTPQSNKYDGHLAHMRKQMAGPVIRLNGYGEPPTILDPNYYWSIDGKPGIAVIPMNGMLSKGASPFAESCMGAVNPDRVNHALQQAIAAKDIKTIVMDVGSPGGRTTAIAETANLVKLATQTRGKTVYTFTDTVMASAAKWIGSQADEIIMTSSSQTGSIGTYLAFLNPKIAMQTAGFNLELFSKGTHKAIGMPGRDLSQQDREYLQNTVDKLNAQFVAAVKSGRPKASEEALRDAKMYDAADAIHHGLADGIVSSWDEFVSLI